MITFYCTANIWSPPAIWIYPYIWTLSECTVMKSHAPLLKAQHNLYRVKTRCNPNNKSLIYRAFAAKPSSHRLARESEIKSQHTEQREPSAAAAVVNGNRTLGCSKHLLLRAAFRVHKILSAAYFFWVLISRTRRSAEPVRDEYLNEAARALAECDTRIVSIQNNLPS